MRRTEIRNAGFGGQGVLLSATIIGKAACVFQKYYATMTQNSGPETGGVRVSFSGPFPCLERACERLLVRRASA